MFGALFDRRSHRAQSEVMRIATANGPMVPSKLVRAVRSANPDLLGSEVRDAIWHWIGKGKLKLADGCRLVVTKPARDTGARH